MAKMMLLVIDSFGIGAMEDCVDFVPSDCKAKTYQHIREKKQDELKIPIMYSLGLGTLVDGIEEPNNAFGFSKLAHHGADTYLGHQEIAGSCPKKSNKRLMKDIHHDLRQALEADGYRVRYPIKDCPVLLVDDFVIVGDNLESAVGNIINVTAALDKNDFDEAKKIGEIVRENVDTTRVITLGGPHTTIDKIIDSIEEKIPKQWGVNTPKAGVYGDDYHVYHMGYGVDIDGQFPMIAAKNELPVYRLGKTADVLHGEGVAEPIVNTSDLLSRVAELYHAEKRDAAFLVNVQETDLAGHAEDVDWYCLLLNEVDAWLGKFIPQMDPDDILIIMADHGNDPTIGHSNHTREYVPIMIVGEKVKQANIGMRETMADVGATFCDFFNLPKTAEGTSFLADIYARES